VGTGARLGVDWPREVVEPAGEHNAARGVTRLHLLMLLLLDVWLGNGRIGESS
jgi:hypothetical protein